MPQRITSNRPPLRKIKLIDVDPKYARYTFKAVLRDIPDEMMREMKMYAAANGGSVRDVIMVAVAQFLVSKKGREVQYEEKAKNDTLIFL